jgi:hypothetical protein
MIFEWPPGLGGYFFWGSFETGYVFFGETAHQSGRGHVFLKRFLWKEEKLDEQILAFK